MNYKLGTTGVAVLLKCYPKELVGICSSRWKNCIILSPHDQRRWLVFAKICLPIGIRNVEAISPDTWDHVQPLLDRPGNQEIQLSLFHSYGSNPPLYPKWQEYLRRHQPPTLIVWGKNDAIFPADGAHPYKCDLRNLEFHLLDTGHFALEEDGQQIASLIRNFLGRQLSSCK